MLKFKEYFVNRVLGDPTLKAMIQNGNVYNVFPTDIDIQPESFPTITFKDAGFAVLSAPQGMHIGIFQVDIWSIKNALEVENIYTRLAQLFNFRDSLKDTLTGTLWWMRENGERDMHTPGRRIWHKVVDFKVWYSAVDNT